MSFSSSFVSPFFAKLLSFFIVFFPKEGTLANVVYLLLLNCPISSLRPLLFNKTTKTYPKPLFHMLSRQTVRHICQEKLTVLI